MNECLETLIANLVLQILYWTAQEERNRIRKCQREGIDNVLNKGLPFGRPKAQVSQELIEDSQ